MIRWADPADVASAAADWTEGQRECRLMGAHSWRLSSTVATKLRNHNMQVRQTCARRCGVARVADMSMHGFLLSSWRMDYSNAKAYLLKDADGRSVGRIDADGRAVLWRTALGKIRIIEQEDQ